MRCHPGKQRLGSSSVQCQEFPSNPCVALGQHRAKEVLAVLAIARIRRSRWLIVLAGVRRCAIESPIVCRTAEDGASQPKARSEGKAALESMARLYGRLVCTCTEHHRFQQMHL